ncbi:hypothetical protein FGO68_gene17284 [Halteria grandinella]|uniref:Uncharacterized protein n=1 Tax=Halteria grandinella TaxID=5974 RepID=A0A8J8NAS9_HALGN|nr:hypothetical protein FGO68_gene17284 [Halteria grandinella]
MGKASSHIFGISSSSGFSQVQNNAIGVSRDQAVNQGIQKRTVDQLAEKQEGNLIFNHNQRSRGTVVQQSTGLIGVSKQPIIQMQKEDGKAHYSQIQKINDSAGESSKIQLSKHSSSKTLPIENKSMDQNRPSAKQYKYWIDVRDLQTILQFTLSNFQQAPLSSTEIWDPDSSCSQSIIKDDNCMSYSSVIGQDFMDYNLRLIKLIVEHDREIEQLFRRFVNTFNHGQLQKGKPLLNIDHMLNFQGPKSLKRIYMIENAKIVTQVYQNKMREDIVNGLNMLLTRLNEYQARYQSKVLRLCFSSQKELYQIFIKVFGRDPFSVQTIRKVRPYLLLNIIDFCRNI